MNLTDEQLKEVESLAELFFSPGDIAIILEVDQECFIRAIATQYSEIYKAYNKGQLLGESKIRKSVMELAENGSSPAQTLMLQLKKESEHRKIIDNA